MIDTHTHIYEKAFDADRAEVVGRAVGAGVVRLLLPSTTEADAPEVLSTCEAFPGVCFPMYGLHPTEFGDDPMGEAERIMAFAEEHAPYVGVGEIGLDLYWDKSRQQEQVEVFRWQMEYAYSHSKPVSIHCREAVWLLMELLDKMGERVPCGSLHCFQGSREEALVIAKKWPQLMFGFGGSSTYKNSKVSEIAAVLPPERILTETDAPYLTPVPHRGKRNEPSYVPLVVARLAEAMGRTPEEVAALTERNAMSLFFPDEA